MDPDTLERYYRRIDDPELRATLDRLIRIAYQTCDKAHEPFAVNPETGEVAPDGYYFYDPHNLIYWLRRSITRACNQGEDLLISVYSEDEESVAEVNQSKKEEQIKTHLIRKARELMERDWDDKRWAKWEEERRDEGTLDGT